jgi:outer membrane protein TolC
LFFTIIASPHLGTTAELSFDQALQQLHSVNETLLAARAEEGQRESERSAARGLYFPRIDTSARFSRIDDPIAISIPQLGTIPVQDDQFWRVNVSFKWPVFTGGRILAANRVAQAYREESQEKRRRVESGLISELARRYYGVRLAEKVTEVRREVLTGMEHHLNDARKMEEQGVIARSEELHAVVTRAEADREYKRAVRNAALARTALNDILSSKEDVTPTSPLFLVRDIGPMEAFREQGLSGNPALKQLAAQREVAHQGYNKELGTFAPEVFLFGVDEIYRKDLTVLDPHWTVGVGVTFNLFEGLSGLHRVAAARKQEMRLEHMQLRMMIFQSANCLHYGWTSQSFLPEARQQAGRLSVGTLVESRYQEVMKALEQYEAIESAGKFAEEYLRIRKSAFAEGYATSLDVVDAHLALSKVKTERLVALYEFDVALAELLESSGHSERFEDYRTRSDVEVQR